MPNHFVWLPLARKSADEPGRSDMGQDFRIGDWVHAVGFDGVLEVVEVNERPRLARLRHPLYQWVTPPISWTDIEKAKCSSNLNLLTPAALSQALAAQSSGTGELADLYSHLIRSRFTMAEAMCFIAEQQFELRQEESAANTMSFLRRIVEDLREIDPAGMPDFTERLSRLEDRVDEMARRRLA